MRVDGICHCGRITYQADVDPEKAFICHCTDCQSLSGSAYRTVIFAEDSGFELLSGEPKVYIKKTADSGKDRIQTFCGDCGSPIYSTSVAEGPKMLGLRVGTLRQRAELPPLAQYWCRSAQDWVSDIGGLKKVEKQ